MNNSMQDAHAGSAACAGHGTVRFVPWLRNLTARTLVGFTLLLAAAIAAGRILSPIDPSAGLIGVLVVSWALSVLLTDKYRHKYPQRYLTYLMASHAKAAFVMAATVAAFVMIQNNAGPASEVLWAACGVFVLLDFVVSLPRKSELRNRANVLEVSTSVARGDGTSRSSQSTHSAGPEMIAVNGAAVLAALRPTVDRLTLEFLETSMSSLVGNRATVCVLEDVTSGLTAFPETPVDVLVSQSRINDVPRLHRYLLGCSDATGMGGYFVGRYTPLENVNRSLRRRYGRFFFWPVAFLHFLWYRAIPKFPLLDAIYFSRAFAWIDSLYLSIVGKRNRVLSKAEVWGRLAFCGFEVISESTGDGERILLAHRISLPVPNRRPSYYPVVALEKVGLNGSPIRMHKLRTMYPFSEFLQKRIFEDHGLTATGKFKDDFRLTEMGKFLRRYWLDEIPQIFDWLQGDVKLVGMRATSRHFLSLYPKELHDLYVEIKPGLIPPIFSESTGGFDGIVKVELTYLQRYVESPLKTDMKYFFQTFADIVFRGVRSK